MQWKGKMSFELGPNLFGQETELLQGHHWEVKGFWPPLLQLVVSSIGPWPAQQTLAVSGMASRPCLPVHLAGLPDPCLAFTALIFEI